MQLPPVHDVARMLRVIDEVVPGATILTGSILNFASDEELTMRVGAGGHEIEAAGATMDEMVADLIFKAVKLGVGRIPSARDGAAEKLAELFDEFGTSDFELTIKRTDWSADASAELVFDGGQTVTAEGGDFLEALEQLREAFENPDEPAG